MSESITHDQWLAELERVRCPPDDTDTGGLTTAEIAMQIGRSTRWVREAIHIGILAGQWELVGRKRIAAIDGRVCHSAVYRPIKAKGHAIE